MCGLVLGKNGWEFHSDKRIYGLYEGMCIDSDRPTTTDLCFIMDDRDLNRDEMFVGYVWGATFIRDSNVRKDWEKAIGRIVERYEKRENMPNGIARLEHAKEIVEAYLTTNEEVIREYEDNGIQEIEKIKRDIEYLATLIEKAKEIQR